MKAVKRLLLAVDGWQRGNRVFGPAYAVIKKFGEDQANLLVVALGWYGFTAIYPLLLVVVTIFGFLGAGSLSDSVVKTLQTFPVIGSEINPGNGGSKLHGSVFGLVIGLAGLMYGAQGVTQTAQQAMAQVWNLPRVRLPGFLSRLVRSLAGLAIIGGAFIMNAVGGAIATGHGHGLWVRIPVIAGMLLCNVGFYYAAFLVLTPPTVKDRKLLPGAIFGAIGFTALTTIGTGLVEHQLRGTTATYGAFAAVIGVVTYLLLLAKLSIYAAELNAVLARRLWPRALPMTPPTVADDQALRALAHQERRRPDERIGVGFEPDPVTEAAYDARESDPDDDGGRGPNARQGDRNGGRPSAHQVARDLPYGRDPNWRDLESEPGGQPGRSAAGRPAPTGAAQPPGPGRPNRKSAATTAWLDRSESATR